MKNCQYREEDSVVLKNQSSRKKTSGRNQLKTYLDLNKKGKNYLGVIDQEGNEFTWSKSVLFAEKESWGKGLMITL